MHRGRDARTVKQTRPARPEPCNRAVCNLPFIQARKSGEKDPARKWLRRCDCGRVEYCGDA